MRTIDRDLDRYVAVLRRLIRERGFTQIEVQEANSWGRSYLSQLLTQQKSLRVEQVLMILNVIGVNPAAFFAEVYGGTATTHGPRSAEATPLPSDQLEATRAEMDRLNALLRGLVSVLEKNGLISTSELARAIEKAEQEP